jgi:outer membrane protein OmpA-like peptidoglycan-associated protein
MKSSLNIFLLLFFALFYLQVNGQKKKIKKANTTYSNLEYINAIEIYKEVAKSGYKSEELYNRLANAFFFNAKYTEALQWFDSLYVLKKGKLSPELLLRFSQSLQSEGKETKAKIIYNQFLSSQDVKNEEFLSAKDYLNIIEKSSERYLIEKLSINSKKYIDFGNLMKNDTLYFASNRADRRMKKNVDTWTNQPFLDMYYSVYNTIDSSFFKPQLVKGDVNSKLHESSPTISKDGKTMYFTRSDNSNEKNTINHLKIYKATRDSIGRWTNVSDLPINNNSYSNAHPILNALEDKLYFVSNRPGGFGQTDIYCVKILSDGNFDKPYNLGSKINTKGRESFPFISEKQELYFSSDGHFGLGGYDVFYINLSSTDKQLINLGKPINSKKDDYAFAINTESRKGFFSTNRHRSDDIYKLIEKKSIKDVFYDNLFGLVVDADTNEYLDSVLVTVRNKNNEIIKSLYSNKEGEFNIEYNTLKSLIIRADKFGYNSNQLFILKNSSTNKVTIPLEKNIVKVKKGIDLSKVLNIVIYFDFDKYAIRDDAKVELEKIVTVLKKYPKLHIDLKAHTDSKGPDVYNLELSEKRANATLNYLVKQGVSKNRLSAEGFGEKEILNKCKNDIKCSKEEHQKNRRTEFIITE